MYCHSCCSAYSVKLLVVECVCVYFTAQSEQIMASVMNGQRPNLAEIPGPENFQKFARSCAEKCWHPEPEQRPTFGGESFYFSVQYSCSFNTTTTATTTTTTTTTTTVAGRLAQNDLPSDF